MARGLKARKLLSQKKIAISTVCRGMGCSRSTDSFVLYVNARQLMPTRMFSLTSRGSMTWALFAAGKNPCRSFLSDVRSYPERRWPVAEGVYVDESSQEALIADRWTWKFSVVEQRKGRR